MCHTSCSTSWSISVSASQMYSCPGTPVLQCKSVASGCLPQHLWLSAAAVKVDSGLNQQRVGFDTASETGELQAMLS
jgi:hypothetical protein